MSLYREVRRRSWRLVAVAGLLGLGAGFAIGLAIGGGGGQPPLRSVLSDLQRETSPALDGLQLVAIEYPQAVEGGKVVAPTEFEAARRDLARVRRSYVSVSPDLAVLDPEAIRRAGSSLSRLNALVEGRGPPRRVKAVAETAISALRRAARIRQAP